MAKMPKVKITYCRNPFNILYNLINFRLNYCSESLFCNTQYKDYFVLVIDKISLETFFEKCPYITAHCSLGIKIIPPYWAFKDNGFYI